MFKITINIDPIRLYQIQSWCIKAFGMESMTYKIIGSTIIDINGYRECECDITFSQEKYISAFMLSWGEEIEIISK